MRTRARLSVLAMFVLTMLLTAGTTALAQEATPEDPSPNPDECTFEPRTIEDMQALYGTPAPEGSGEATSAAQATPVDFTLPEGEAADEAVVAEIETAIRGLTACNAAGNYLAGLGGTTDDFIVSQIGLDLFDEDFVAVMEGDPVPVPEDEQTVVLGVREVTVLEDGRVSALFDYNSPLPQEEGIDGVETDLFIFENVDGLWLLDESVQNLEGEFGPDSSATPAA